MTTTHLGLDEEEKERRVYEARMGAGRRRRGSYACEGGARRGRRMVWGATCMRMAVACAHVRPLVARLWKKFAARRKVKALSVGSSQKSSKKLISCRWERM
jgi:hypothetical protein